MDSDDKQIEYTKLIRSPLIQEIIRVLHFVSGFKDRAKEFYFEVVLSPFRCPLCSGRLKMTGQSQCSCSCGNTFDPTTAFQKSTCCQAKLIMKTFHYACSRCHKTVPSRFLFDEKVFDKEYFREMMLESRERTKRKRDEIRKLLADSRSGSLSLLEDPDFDGLPGFFADLDDFIRSGAEGCSGYSGLFQDKIPGFKMDSYRNHILSILTWNALLFSKITPLMEDHRLDKVRRFITLIFMQQDREVIITQNGEDLLVQRVCHEAYSEG